MFRQLVRRTAAIGRTTPTKTLAPHVPSSSALVASFHASSRDENSLILGGAAIAVSAVVLQYVVKAMSSMPAEPEAESKEEKEKETLEGHSINTEAPSSSSEGREAKEAAGKKAGEAGSFYASWFDKQFYKGGFESKMTKREAALILGVRESASVERINLSYRRILLLNHPDKGGSAYMATKINEAKVLLLKGKA